MAHRLGRNHFGVVDSRGQRLDAAPCGHDVQPRYGKERDERLCRRGPVADSGDEVLPRRYERLGGWRGIRRWNKLLVLVEKTR